VRSATLTRIERRLDVVLLVAAVAVVPVIIIEQSHASQTAKSAADVANWVIWLLFAGESALMLGFSVDRRGWAERHKLELAVVILTPPVLPAGLQMLRVLRLLRLLRLVVAVKLAHRLFTAQRRRRTSRTVTPKPVTASSRRTFGDSPRLVYLQS